MGKVPLLISIITTIELPIACFSVYLVQLLVSNCEIVVLKCKLAEDHFNLYELERLRYTNLSDQLD